MLIERLSICFPIRERIEKDREALAALRSISAPGSLLDGMPRTPGASDRVGTLAGRIVSLESVINRLELELEVAEGNVEQLINDITPDEEYIRAIFGMRFISCMTWRQIAGTLGNGNTSDSVRALCYRYLRKAEKDFISS